MKSRFIIFLAAVLITPFIMTSCDEELDIPPIDTVEEHELLVISDIYQIYADSGNNYTFEDDYILYGTVTMDDIEGNIYKEVYLEDTSGGINVYKLSYAGLYEVGQHLRLNLNGVSIVDYEGKLELVFTDILDVDKSIVLQQSEVPITPALVTIDDINTGDYNCMLIQLQNVQFETSDTSLTFATEGGTFATNRTAEDCSGKTILIRTSDYADFAGNEIPNGNGTIVAIATEYRGDWQLLVRSIDEVEMAGPRCDDQ